MCNNKALQLNDLRANGRWDMYDTNTQPTSCLHSYSLASWDSQGLRQKHNRMRRHSLNSASHPLGSCSFQHSPLARSCLREVPIAVAYLTKDHYALRSPGRKLARCHWPNRGPPCHHQAQSRSSKRAPRWRDSANMVQRPQGHARELLRSAVRLTKVVLPVQTSPRSR